MQTQRPPEGWLLKAIDGEVLVDLIWEFEGDRSIDELLEEAEELSVQAVRLPVLRLEDVVVSKLQALDEHALDLAGPLAISRALREQIDWRAVRARTGHSPCARGFVALLEALEIIGPTPAPRGHQARVRVIPGG